MKPNTNIMKYKRVTGEMYPFKYSLLKFGVFCLLVGFLSGLYGTILPPLKWTVLLLIDQCAEQSHLYMTSFLNYIDSINARLGTTMDLVVLLFALGIYESRSFIWLSLQVPFHAFRGVCRYMYTKAMRLAARLYPVCSPALAECMCVPAAVEAESEPPIFNVIGSRDSINMPKRQRDPPLNIRRKMDQSIRGKLCRINYEGNQEFVETLFDMNQHPRRKHPYSSLQCKRRISTTRKRLQAIKRRIRRELYTYLVVFLVLVFGISALIMKMSMIVPLSEPAKEQPSCISQSIFMPMINETPRDQLCIQPLFLPVSLPLSSSSFFMQPFCVVPTMQQIFRELSASSGSCPKRNISPKWTKTPSPLMCEGVCPHTGKLSVAEVFSIPPKLKKCICTVKSKYFQVNQPEPLYAKLYAGLKLIVLSEMVMVSSLSLVVLGLCLGYDMRVLRDFVARVYKKNEMDHFAIKTFRAEPNAHSPTR
jgi:hypothetical protein